MGSRGFGPLEALGTRPRDEGADGGGRTAAVWGTRGAEGGTFVDTSHDGAISSVFSLGSPRISNMFLMFRHAVPSGLSLGCLRYIRSASRAKSSIFLASFALISLRNPAEMTVRYTATMRFSRITGSLLSVSKRKDWV